VIEFLRAFARPYAAIVIISAIVGLGIYLGIKFGDADLARQVITAILVAGTAIISFMFGERAAKKPKE